MTFDSLRDLLSVNQTQDEKFNASSFPTITLCLGISALMELLLTVTYLAFSPPRCSGHFTKIDSFQSVKKATVSHHRCLQDHESLYPGTAGVSFGFPGFLGWTRTFTCGSVESLAFNRNVTEGAFLYPTWTLIAVLGWGTLIAVREECVLFLYLVLQVLRLCICIECWRKSKGGLYYLKCFYHKGILVLLDN